MTLMTLMLGGTGQIFAKRTKVGRPWSESYVDLNNPSPIIIYIGDSRVMYCTVGEENSDVRQNFAFIYVNGGILGHFWRIGGKLTSRVEEYLELYRPYHPTVVLNFGLNGNRYPEDNAAKIIETYGYWMEDYPDIRFYVEGIGPTKKNKGVYSNSRINRLNAVLKAYYEPKGMWIDTYSSLKRSDLRDKLHYKKKTSRKIMQQIRERVESDIAAGRR